MWALRAVLAVVLAGTVFVQAAMVWALATGSDPEDGSLPLTALRVVTIVGMVSVQVAAGLRLAAGDDGATRNRLLPCLLPVRGHRDRRDRAAALVWFAVTVLNAPGQRADPGVTLIMGGVGMAILGVALIVLLLRMLLAQAVARDIEASRLQAELDEVI